jgi:hypothetical protein
MSMTLQSFHSFFCLGRFKCLPSKSYSYIILVFFLIIKFNIIEIFRVKILIYRNRREKKHTHRYFINAYIGKLLGNYENHGQETIDYIHEIC